MEQTQNYTQEDVTIANRSINIAYILAGCLQQSCEDMTQYLTKINSDLKFDNKRQVNIILDLSNKLIKAVDKLERMSILKCDEDSVYAHDCARDHYYAILLRSIQIMGADSYSEVRALYIYNYLKQFKDYVEMPKMRLREDMAFYGVRRRLAEGKIDINEARKCLELKPREVTSYENQSDKPETDNGEN